VFLPHKSKKSYKSIDSCVESSVMEPLFLILYRAPHKHLRVRSFPVILNLKPDRTNLILVISQNGLNPCLKSSWTISPKKKHFEGSPNIKWKTLIKEIRIKSCSSLLNSSYTAKNWISKVTLHFQKTPDPIYVRADLKKTSTPVTRCWLVFIIVQPNGTFTLKLCSKGNEFKIKLANFNFPKIENGP